MKNLAHPFKNRSPLFFITTAFFAVLILAMFLGSVAFCFQTEIEQYRHQAVQAKHLEDDKHGFYTNLTINGTSLGNVLVDTGAADTSISMRDARKAHLSWTSAKVVDYIMADNSINKCYLINATVRIGTLERNAPVSICNSGDPLLGMSFVSQATLHVEKDTMAIY